MIVIGTAYGTLLHGYEAIVKNYSEILITVNYTQNCAKTNYFSIVI
jgi:hypothetical protein